MYVTMGRDRLCVTLCHVVMPLFGHGPSWQCQPLPVSTVPNIVRNLSNSNYRGPDEEGHA